MQLRSDLVHINPETDEEWRKILHWYHEKYGDYGWEPQPIGDHIKVWFTKEQYDKTYSKDLGSENFDESDKLLGYASWDDYMINKDKYDEYLMDNVSE